MESQSETRRNARHFASKAALLAALLLVIYAAVLVTGLATLRAPDTPISDPWFTMMEGLILLLSPVLIALAAGLYLSADDASRPIALTGLGLMIAAAALTAVVHFSVLVLSRHQGFPDAPHLLSFQWPSAVYVLDILAWDAFFALAVICLAPSLAGGGVAAMARRLLYVTGVLSLAGLAGVPLDDMAVRNIGILGYVVAFIPACIAIHIACKRPIP